MTTVAEWSAEFDIMWNNIMSNQAPGLSEYEKSVFLTDAQEQIVLEKLSPKTNIKGEGFDDSLIRQKDFESLIVVGAMTTYTPDSAKQLDARGAKYFKYDPASPKPLIVLNEMCNETVGTIIKEYVVMPISYAEYMRLMSKPYKYPPKGIAWRLKMEENSSTPTVELIGRFNGTPTYKIRYVKRPAPIVLANITPSIEGVSTAQPCALPEHLHQEILRRAVNLAKIAWSEPKVEQTQ